MPEEHNGPVLLRSQIDYSMLYRIFNIVFALLFSGIVLLAVFHNRQTDDHFSWYLLLCCLAMGVLMFILLHYIVSQLSAKTRRAEVPVVIFLFLLFMALQAYMGWSLRLVPSQANGFGAVYTSAENYVLNGVQPGDYFLLNQHDTGLYVFFTGFFGLLHRMGMSDFTLPAMLLNILSIDLSILFLFLSVRTLMGKRKALFVLLAAFATLPFLLLVPVYYSNTLALVFPSAAAYLWIRARQRWRKGEQGAAIARFCILSALLATGALLKMSVFIVWIAIALDALLMLRGGRKALMVLAGLALSAALLLGGTWAMRRAGSLPDYNYDEGIPLAYWVMAGLGQDGAATDNDYSLILTQPDGAARSTLAGDQIKNRLSDKGFFGTLGHLGDKLAYTFGDGLYEAQTELAATPEESASLHQWVVPTGRFYWLTAYLGFAVEMAMLAALAFSAIRSILRKNNALTFVRVAGLGLVLFLLVWSTSPGALIVFLPLLLLGAVEALPIPAPPRPARPSRGPKPLPAAAPLEDEATMVLPALGSQTATYAPGAMEAPTEEFFESAAVGEELPQLYEQPAQDAGQPYEPGETVEDLFAEMEATPGPDAGASAYSQDEFFSEQEARQEQRMDDANAAFWAIEQGDAGTEAADSFTGTELTAGNTAEMPYSGDDEVTGSLEEPAQGRFTGTLLEPDAYPEADPAQSDENAYSKPQPEPLPDLSETNLWDELEKD